jgi:hypothetical protein
MQKNRFSNITSYKTANAPKPFNPPDAPKIDPKFEKKLLAAKNIDELKKAYSSGGKSEAAAKQREGAVAKFIELSNKLKKTAKGSAGQRSTTTKSTKPAPVQPKGKSTKPAPVQPAKNKGNTGSSRDGRSGTGTYGKQLPSNPQLKSQTKPKTKSKVQRAVDAATKPRNRRGSGVQRTGKKGINLRKLVDKVGKKLVYKKGDIKKVGGITYRHDGKRFVRYTM